jgi:hypothetical protein
MSRQQLFEQALAQCERLHADRPNLAVLNSIIAQLKYLLAVENGEDDTSRLGEIMLGVQAARELENIDLGLAELLYKVDDAAKSLRKADPGSRPG